MNYLQKLKKYKNAGIIALIQILIILVIPFSTVQASPTVVTSNGTAFNSTQKNIIRTSNGTLHSFIVSSTAYTCDGVSAGGVLWMISSDEGGTWTCQKQLVSSATNRISAVKDSYDNLYVAYGSGGSIYYRKLTNIGSSWSIGDQQTVITIVAPITAYINPDITVDGTSRVWISTRITDNGNHDAMVFYSDNQTDAPTWSAGTRVSDASSSVSTDYTTSLVSYGSRIGIFYGSGTNLLFKSRDSADGLTTWSSSTTVLTGSTGSIGTRFAATADSNGHVHVVGHTNNSATSPGPIKYAYHDGTTWFLEVIIASTNLFGGTTSSVKISTDGTSVWIFYPDRTGFSGPADTGRLVYKKGVSPFGSANFDTNATAVNTYEKTFDKVWIYNTSGGTYTEETTDAASTNSSDVTFQPAIDSMFYLGMSERFQAFNPHLSTNGATGVVAYEYWNGTTWTSLTLNGSVNPNLSSCTSTSVNAACGIWFNPPTDWATTNINSELTSYYYIRGRITTAFTTTPTGTQLRAINKVNSLAAELGETGLAKVNLLWGNNLNSATPVTITSGSLLLSSNNAPTNPSSLGPTSSVDGGNIVDTTPEFTFTLADPDGADTVRYQLQLSTSANFSTQVIDYTSSLDSTGSKSFTVGQAAGTGTYTTGSEGQTLSEGGYYWRVRTIDNTGAYSGYTSANSGSMAFSIDTTSPSTPGTPTTTNPTSDTTPSWTWNVSVDAASGLATPAYTLEWSTDNTFNSDVSTTTSSTNSYTHSTPLALGTWYMRVKAEDRAGYESNWSTNGSVLIVSTDLLVVGTLTTASTYESISVYANFTDDSDNSTAILEYKKSSDSSWIRGMDMTVDRRSTVTSQGTSYANTYENQFRASVLGLDSNTSYDIRVTFSDPDGVIGGSGSDSNQATTTVTTRNETIPTGSGVTYYVATDGSDSADGLSTSTPFLTIQKAANVANPGDVILVRGGTYTSASAPVINLIRSGLSTAYIDFQNYPDETVIIDASLSPATCGTGTASALICGIRTNASYIRFKGFEIIGGNLAIKMDSPSTNVIVDGNNIHGQVNNPAVSIYSTSIMMGNNAGSTANLVENIVVQNNTIVSPTTLDADADETSGLISFWNTAGGHIIRNNTVSYNYDGVMGRHGGDCVSGGTNAYIFSGPHKDTDIYNNTCIDATDDGIEIDGGAINVRVWGNKISGANQGISIAPNIVGPAYIFRNTIANLKVHWTTACDGIKSGETGAGETFIYHNVFYAGTIDPDCATGSSTYASNGSDGPSENVYMKNNIMWGAYRIFNVGKAGEDVTSDYNVLFRTNTSFGTFSKTKNVFYTTFDLYKSGTLQDLNSINDQPAFINPITDFQLANISSPGINAGTVLTGFNDLNSAWAFQGNAPDMGAYESSFTSQSDSDSNNNTNNNAINSSSHNSNGNNNNNGCGAPSPSTADLFQIDASYEKATLYITKPSGNTNRFIINYGYDEQANNFSTTVDINNQIWITPVEIKYLAPNTNYSFKVRAVNDCTPGPEGKVMSIKTSSGKSVVNKFFKSSKPIQRVESLIRTSISNTKTSPILAPVPNTIQKPTAPSSPSNQNNTNVPPQNSPQKQNKGFFETIINTIKGWFRN